MKKKKERNNKSDIYEKPKLKKVVFDKKDLGIVTASGACACGCCATCSGCASCGCAAGCCACAG